MPDPVARLLDITRVLSRAGEVPTGIDRVEAAYLRYLLGQADRIACFGLAKTALGYCLLDRRGMLRLKSALEEGLWPFPDGLSLANPRLTPAMRRGQTLARRWRMARCLPNGLAAMLNKHLPRPFEYLNVGHSNLIEPTLAGLRTFEDAQISVMLHDTIPLDFPDWQRPGASRTFHKKVSLVSRHADRVIAIAKGTRAAMEPHLAAEGRVPAIVTAHLGLRGIAPAPADIPPGALPDKPYFITVGTIEPRKNHRLLLDVWDAMDEDGPELLVCGGRGWNNEDVFARLDRGVLNVRELPGLSDGAIAALIRGSRGLLFPSYAEGFGLPPIEAAMQGVPVVCATLPVYQEILGDRAIYLDPGDVYGWKREIERLTRSDPDPAMAPFVPPSWDDHFKTVFTLT